MSVQLFVGTAGMSVWMSDDLGATWSRPYSESGLYLEARCWALSEHSQRPGEVLAGTDSGVYRWTSATESWRHLPSPMDAMNVWALAQAADDPDIIIAGTQPAGLYRSDNGGKDWRRLPQAFAESCPFVQTPRVTQVLFDPDDGATIWAGVEIDGVHLSRDGGATWERRNDGLLSDDVHGLCVHGGADRRVFATTNKGLHVSDDDGAHWRFQELDSPWQYTRTIQQRPDDPDRLWLTNGNGPPGSSGRLLRSSDAGASWRDAGLPGQLNSTPWCIATDPSDPDLVFVASNLGQLFRSQDGGHSWTKLDRELGEVRAMLWQPAPS